MNGQMSNGILCVYANIARIPMIHTGSIRMKLIALSVKPSIIISAICVFIAVTIVIAAMLSIQIWKFLSI